MISKIHLTWGSSSQPWQRGMSSRSNTMHSGVYSKTRTPVNFTFTSRPVCSLCNTAMASLMFQETRRTTGLIFHKNCVIPNAAEALNNVNLELTPNKSLKIKRYAYCVLQTLYRTESCACSRVFMFCVLSLFVTLFLVVCTQSARLQLSGIDLATFTRNNQLILIPVQYKNCFHVLTP